MNFVDLATAIPFRVVRPRDKGPADFDCVPTRLHAEPERFVCLDVPWGESLHQVLSVGVRSHIDRDGFFPASGRTSPPRAAQPSQRAIWFRDARNGPFKSRAGNRSGVCAQKTTGLHDLGSPCAQSLQLAIVFSPAPRFSASDAAHERIRRSKRCIRPLRSPPTPSAPPAADTDARSRGQAPAASRSARESRAAPRRSAASRSRRPTRSSAAGSSPPRARSSPWP